MCPARRRWLQVLVHENPSPTARRTRARAAICVAALPLDRSATIVTKKARGTHAMSASRVTISGRGTGVGPAIPAARAKNAAKLDRSEPATIAVRETSVTRVGRDTRGTSGGRGRSMRPLAAT